MSLTEPLQTTVPVLGRAVEINTDFRIGIRFESLMMDPALSDAEKCEGAVHLWFDNRIEETPEAIEEALLGAMAFWKRETGHAVQDEGEGETKPRERPVISYEIDADLIHAAFLSAYGIDLMREDLHWHEFLSLLSSLPDETRLMKVIGHRCAKVTPDFRTVKMYSGGTSGWQVVHDEKKGMRFKLRNDLVTQNGITNFGPLDLVAEGSQEEGDYGQNMSNGVKILKAGWYMCSANIHISDSPHLTGAYQMRLVVANRVVDGTQYTIGENYVTTNTISAPKQYLASGNPSGVVYLKAGEIVAIHLIPPKTTGLYRVSSAQTHMDIYPLRLD